MTSERLCALPASAALLRRTRPTSRRAAALRTHQLRGFEDELLLAPVMQVNRGWDTTVAQDDAKGSLSGTC